MQTIQILIEKGLPTVIIDGKKFDRLHSFSLDYVKGAPLLFSCVADVGEDRSDAPKIIN
nr:MAG TPA: hypothetical protein [Caudoviricetes sp.]